MIPINQCRTCRYYKHVELFDLYTKSWTCIHDKVMYYVSCQPKTFGCIYWATHYDK